MHKILKYIDQHGHATVKEISEYLSISRQYIHRKLKVFLKEGLVMKLGSAPTVYYEIAPQSVPKSPILNIAKQDTAFLKKHFIQITELGIKLNGIEAMEYWCNKQKLPIEKTTKEFIKTRNKYLNYYNAQNLIDGTEKLANTNGI